MARPKAAANKIKKVVSVRLSNEQMEGLGWDGTESKSAALTRFIREYLEDTYSEETTLGHIWDEWGNDPVADWGYPEDHNLTPDIPARFRFHHDSWLLEYQDPKDPQRS